MTKRKTNGYEAGKLASDIAYIKAGIVDLQEKREADATWQRGVEARLATGAEKFASLMKADGANVTAVLTQSKRVDDVLKEGRITTLIATTVAAIVGVMFGPRNG